MDKEQLKDIGESIGQTAKSAGKKVGDAFTGLKDKIVAKLSEENAVTPEQKIRNLEAKADAAEAIVQKVERELLNCKAEAEKYQRYIEKANADGETVKARRFETAMADIAEKLPDLKEQLEAANAELQAIRELIDTLKNPQNDEPVAEEISEPVCEGEN